MKASIIIPAYNVEPYIEDTLKSALNQNFPNNLYEIVVVDDGSTDDTPNRIESIAKKNPNIRFFPREHKGVSAARNFALDIAEGEHNVLLDSDDMFVPETIEKCINELEKGYDFVYSDHLEVRKHGKEIIGERRKSDLHPYIKEALYFFHFMGHVRAFRRNNIRYDEELKVAEDLDFHLKILEANYGIGHIPKILYKYMARDFSVEKDREAEMTYYHSRALLPHLKRLYNTDNVTTIPTQENGFAWHEHIVNGKRISLRKDLKKKWMDFCSN